MGAQVSHNATDKKKRKRSFPLYRVMQALVFILFVPAFRLRLHNRRAVPRKGPFIMVCNHINMLDPLILSMLTTRLLRFMAKVEVFKTPILRCVVNGVGGFPINRGAADLSGIRTSLSILKDGGGLLIFPEGHRNPRKGGTLLPLHDGVAMIALKSGVPIVPCYISGKYNFFTGLKVNVGDPIDFSDMDSRRVDKSSLAVCTSRMRDAIHKAGNIKEEVGGISSE